MWASQRAVTTSESSSCSWKKDVFPFVKQQSMRKKRRNDGDNLDLVNFHDVNLSDSPGENEKLPIFAANKLMNQTYYSSPCILNPSTTLPKKFLLRTLIYAHSLRVPEPSTTQNSIPLVVCSILQRKSANFTVQGFEAIEHYLNIMCISA